MHPQLPPIETFLTGLIVWTLGHDGNIYAEGTNGCADIIDDDYLTDAHSLLPLALRALLKYEDGWTYGSEVGNLVHLLLYGGVDLTDEVGNRRIYKSINDIFVSGTQVIIKGNCWSINTVVEHDIKVPLITTSGIKSHDYPREKIDHQFPGWANRYLIGLGLGMPEEELFKHVFSTETTLSNSSNIEGLTFD